MLIAGAVAIGLGLALAVWKLPAARSFLTVLAAAPIVFLALFLLDSPTSKLVISSGTAEAAAIRTRATTPIVFLLLDEFPVIDLQQADGGIDAKRFPNFARLAASSTWYRNTTTVSASTTVAVPAILSGQKPKRGALPIFRDHPNNLFTLLGKRYRMVVHESQTRLCPQRLCKQKTADTGSRLSSLYSDVRVVYLHLIAPPELEQRLPVIDESWGNFGSGVERGGGPGRDRLERPAEGRPRHLLPQPRPRLPPLRRLVPASPGAARRRSTSCTTCSRTRPGCTSRTAARGPCRARTRPAATASAGSTASSRRRPGSGTCCRSATPTGCWGRSSRGCTRSGSGTRRS